MLTEREKSLARGMHEGLMDVIRPLRDKVAALEKELQTERATTEALTRAVRCVEDRDLLVPKWATDEKFMEAFQRCYDYRFFQKDGMSTEPIEDIGALGMRVRSLELDRQLFEHSINLHVRKFTEAYLRSQVLEILREYMQREKLTTPSSKT